MRDFEEIKQFTLDKIEKAGKYFDVIQVKIENDEALNREEADVLVEYLGTEARIQMEKALRNKSNHSILLETDDLSIYSEAWAQYCRKDRLARVTVNN